MTHRLFGAILLVAGTTIGAGMLALPVVTGFAGFFPTVSLFLIYWVYMTFTAFLVLEVNLWMSERCNLITMAKRTLGRGGEIASWFLYLFLLYALTTAYLAGGGLILFEMAEDFWQVALPRWLSPFSLLILFGFFVYQGARLVDYVNQLLMVGLAVSFVLMLAFLWPHVEMPLLATRNWDALWIALSIVSTSFGFHIIIPSLTDYLKRDLSQIKWALLVGSAIPLFAYICWEFLTLGIIPLQGAFGIKQGFEQGLDGAFLLSLHLQSSSFKIITRFFSLFAIITSFLGVSLSLRDFLADGLSIQKTAKGRMLLYLLTFAPPLMIALTDPRAFLNALEYAGAFGVVALLGLFPVLMAWRGRYIQKREGAFTTPGGKWALLLALLFSLLVMGVEILNKTGILYTATG